MHSTQPGDSASMTAHLPVPHFENQPKITFDEVESLAAAKTAADSGTGKQ